jgi:hypothetical protein
MAGTRLKHRCPCFGIACRRKHNLYLFLFEYGNQLFNIRIQEGNIYTKGFICGDFALLNVLPEYGRIHGTSPDNAQSPCIGNGRCQPPARAPDHARLYDGILNAKEFTNSVAFKVHFS